ncbi:type VII secretion protein EccCa [Mycobacterium intracellulare]|uniref:type VII secretion protein EccCa n=1 Tax=Mycobacterium intracellulare TaxID=1767 RepID=UPI000A8562CA|nr:type VII secretion protein EccCa [Mycobacterium intracellulare]
MKLEAPIVAPVPPPRSIWGIVLPVALIVGVVGLIVVMYASGARQLASGFGIFGGMAAFSAVGLVVRNRGASRKMPWGELTARRRKSMSDLDDKREMVDVQRRLQWGHRSHFHWDPQDLMGVAGSVRMWDREPGNAMFSVVRVGVGKVKLAMTLELPEIARAADLEPVTGHALRRFLNAQEYVDGVPKAIWLQRFPGLAIVGDVEQARALVRALLCQLAAFHSPADVQIIVVSAAPSQWEWAKWLPHFQHETVRDGCGERRMLFASPAALEAFFDQDPTGARESWSQPSSSMSTGAAGSLPLRVIVDDNCATPEDWAGLTGANGYAGTCFVRVAAAMPARPATALGGTAKHWVGFTSETTYRIADGVLRKQVTLSERARQTAAMYGGSETTSDELEEAFYATADQMSVDEAERFARTLARYRAPGSASVTVAHDIEQRSLHDVLGIADPRHLDTDRLWAGTRAYGAQWMRFPIGLYCDTGEVAELNLREGSQGGMGMHGLFIGNTGAGKTEGLITSVAAACLTHSPAVLNIVFTDFKLKSAAGTIGRFPHTVASVSNLAEESHLVGRLYDTLDGELDRRGEMLAALDDCPDVTTYNQRRLLDPSLPPIPALWVITDEYNEVFADPIWGPKFRRLYLRIARVGRSLHVFLNLVGQTKDAQNLRDITKLLGYSIAARTGTEEESQAAIGDKRAAHIALGEEGTAYLRVALREPRRFRYFYSSADFVPSASASEDSEAPRRGGAQFTPRVFGAAQSEDIDGRLVPAVEPEQPGAVPEVAEPAEKPIKLVNAYIEALQAATERPPRAIWLPVLGDPLAVDELVARRRGRPWHVDYGDNPGLSLPVALADYPRGARQEPYCLDLLRDNALIVAAPSRGATTTVMTMVTAAALLYTPARVQFYCIAASGPQLARVADLPHVAAVVAGTDSEGVNRLVATVEAIAAERDRVFTTQRLDMDKVRTAKFGTGEYGVRLSAAEAQAARAVPGGEIVLVIDGWKKFSETYYDLSQRVASLMRARNEGIRVVLTHTSAISGVPAQVSAETGQRLELKLIQDHDSGIKRNPRDPGRNPAAEVPDIPGRGLTADGHHLKVGIPVLADTAGLTGVLDVERGPLEGDELAAVVRRVAGVGKASTVARLPEKVLLEQVFAGIAAPLPAGVVPFGLAEANQADSPLITATIDFADHPHVIATGMSGAGLSTWLRAMMTGIMRCYGPEDATIILLEHRRANIGVVPPEWLSAYGQNPEHIADIVKDLCALLDARKPPPTATPEQLATQRFWTGREVFVVVDGITAWGTNSNPLTELAPYVVEAEDLGLHLVVSCDIGPFGYQSQGYGALGRIASMQPPIFVMNGDRAHGAVRPGVFAQPQREGKGQLVTRRGVQGVLVGWSEPPLPARRRGNLR